MDLFDHRDRRAVRRPRPIVRRSIGSSRRSSSVRRAVVAVLAVTAAWALAPAADATSVRTLARLKGHVHNEIIGIGIVVGLDGTGDDSDDSLVAARPFARLLTNLGNPVSDFSELADADAYAIVSVTMRIPATGASEGDRYDVFIEKLYNAESLAGGRLVPSLLRLPMPDAPDLPPMAMASGALEIIGDDLSSAVVRSGGQMLVDVNNEVVGPGGTLTLVLEPQFAGYAVATVLAEAINEPQTFDGRAERIAHVRSAREVRVRIPQADLADPAAFIAWLMTLPVDPSLVQPPPRIVVNPRAGIIAITSDVHLGPVAITHRGLRIENVAAAGPGPGGTPRRWAGLDTTDGTSRSSTRLADLLNALDQLAVPVEEQISILQELQRTGALHAEIVGP